MTPEEWLETAKTNFDSPNPEYATSAALIGILEALVGALKYVAGGNLGGKL